MVHFVIKPLKVYFFIQSQHYTKICEEAFFWEIWMWFVESSMSGWMSVCLDGRTLGTFQEYINDVGSGDILTALNLILEIGRQ